jgi:hypothetical protein
MSSNWARHYKLKRKRLGTMVPYVEWSNGQKLLDTPWHPQWKTFVDLDIAETDS